MTTWRCPSGTSLLHSQSWWIASFCHSFKCNYMPPSINIHFQRMTTWRCPSGISLRHFQSWWIASFYHSFKCNYMPTPINIHVSKNDYMKMSFRYIFAPQSVLVILHSFVIHSNAIVRQHWSISIFQRMMIWKCSLSTSLYVDCWWGFTRSRDVFEQHCPQLIWTCSQEVLVITIC
jgi:hypothetical protein